jgi:hypothetical protein
MTVNKSSNAHYPDNVWSHDRVHSCPRAHALLPPTICVPFPPFFLCSHAFHALSPPSACTLPTLSMPYLPLSMRSSPRVHALSPPERNSPQTLSLFNTLSLLNTLAPFNTCAPPPLPCCLLLVQGTIWHYSFTPSSFVMPMSGISGFNQAKHEGEQVPRATQEATTFASSHFNLPPFCLRSCSIPWPAQQRTGCKATECTGH